MADEHYAPSTQDESVDNEPEITSKPNYDDILNTELVVEDVTTSVPSRHEVHSDEKPENQVIQAPQSTGSARSNNARDLVDQELARLKEKLAKKEE